MLPEYLAGPALGESAGLLNGIAAPIAEHDAVILYHMRNLRESVEVAGSAGL
jgi:hypothetical protein